MIVVMCKREQVYKSSRAQHRLYKICKRQIGEGLKRKGYYWPNKEVAMGIIVVSLPCTAYQWEALIA